MIAVVTGGSGFVGQNLVRRLHRDGHEVRCLVRPSGRPAPRKAKRYVVQYDDPNSLLKCAAFDAADVIFHLAGATKAVRAADFMAANVSPTRHLLGALRARRLQPRFLFVSSQAAAGPAPARHRPIDEEDIPRPVEAYGRSKLEAERIVESFSDHIATTIVRPCSVFGPADRDFLPLFRLAERGILLYPGVADHWISVLYVDDLMDGLLAAATRNEAISRTFFLASESPVQWRELGEHIGAAAGRRVRHIDVHSSLVRAAAYTGEWIGRLTRTATLANRSKAALSRQHFWVCSASRARRELGFTASHSLPDAVRATYYWYRQNGWLGGSRGAAGAVA
ncbi:MAG: NAD-dependent epimerase/dehydratase family protein [Gemmatimonadaceae bacterium]